MNGFFCLCRIFSAEEIKEIRGIRLSDIIINSTTIEGNEIQRDVFRWLAGDPCEQPMQLNATVLEPCRYLQGFDYFEVIGNGNGN
jgi:dual oxidase